MKNLKHWGQNIQDTQDQRKTMIKQSAPTTRQIQWKHT